MDGKVIPFTGRKQTREVALAPQHNNLGKLESTEVHYEMRSNDGAHIYDMDVNLGPLERRAVLIRNNGTECVAVMVTKKVELVRQAPALA